MKNKEIRRCLCQSCLSYDMSKKYFFYKNENIIKNNNFSTYMSEYFFYKGCQIPPMVKKYFIQHNSI